MSLGEYERDDELDDSKIKLIHKTAKMTAFMCLLIFFMMIMFGDLNTNDGQLDFGRYLVDAFTWMLISVFLYFLHTRFTRHRNNMEIKTISRFVSVACCVKLITTILYVIPLFRTNIFNITNCILDIYYVSKVLVWLFLTLFFYQYKKEILRYDFRHFEDEEEEEEN